jgi:exopolysaccharide production protein ExoY
VTGLWQVSGRSNLSYKDRVALDSAYVRKWSLWLDIAVMLRTIPAVLSFHETA